jgi:hypothetical protein
MRSASATNRLITRSNSRLCSGPVAVFNSEAIASSLRCTWAKSWLGMYWIMPVTAERLNIIAGATYKRSRRQYEKVRTTPRTSNRNWKAQLIDFHGREGQDCHHRLHTLLQALRNLEQFKLHITEDVLPPLLNKLSTEEPVSG